VGPALAGPRACFCKACPIPAWPPAELVAAPDSWIAPLDPLCFHSAPVKVPWNELQVAAYWSHSPYIFRFFEGVAGDKRFPCFKTFDGPSRPRPTGPGYQRFHLSKESLPKKTSTQAPWPPRIS